MKHCFSVVVLVSLLFVAVGCGGGGSSDSVCNRLGLDARVLNGEACTDLDSPIVSVGISFGDDVPDSCTGVMITPNQVLTAGHCIPNDPTAVAIYVGGRVARAEAIRIHPSYAIQQSGEILYDLGLIDLDHTIGIRTLPIIVTHTPVPGEEVDFFGYGSDEDARSGVLKAGVLTVDSVEPRFISTIYSGKGQNPCGGDAGGPLVVSAQDAPDVRGIVGILSVGTVERCGAGDKPRYINLQDPAVLSWIRTYAPAVLLR